MLPLFRGLLLLAAFVSTVLAASGSRPSRKSTLPNFVLVVADDLAAWEIAAGRSNKVQTPNLDRLAAEGMRFTEAYAGAADSAPARAALLTGRHAGHGRVRSGTQVPLAPEDVTLAEVLRSVGYRNAVVGLWGLGWEGTTGVPSSQGFDEFLGCLDLVHGQDDRPTFLWRNGFPFVLASSQTANRKLSAPAWLFRGATNFVRISEEQPFFLLYAPSLPGGATNLGISGIPTANLVTNQAGSPYERARATRLLYLDEQIGLILEDLRRRHLDSDTLILLTSAPASPSPASVPSKRSRPDGPWRTGGTGLYEGSLRVPLLTWWPGRIKPGSTNNLPVAAWDLLPTIAELAGAPLPPGIDGRSFAPVLFGKTAPTNRAAFYWENHNDGFARAARIDRWKVVQPGENQALELFDLETDPGEATNVGGTHPDLVSQFEALLAANFRPWNPPADGAAVAAGRPGIAPPTNMFDGPMRTNYPRNVPKAR